MPFSSTVVNQGKLYRQYALIIKSLITDMLSGVEAGLLTKESLYKCEPCILQRL